MVLLLEREPKLVDLAYCMARRIGPAGWRNGCAAV
jgi:hypothetical protein